MEVRRASRRKYGEEGEENRRNRLMETKSVLRVGETARSLLHRNNLSPLTYVIGDLHDHGQPSLATLNTPISNIKSIVNFEQL